MNGFDQVNLHRHFHDFLIRGNHFVANLHEHLKLEIGALRGQNGGMQVTAVAGKELLYALGGAAA